MDITLDLRTVTLGEAAAVEEAARRDFTDLIARRTTRNMVALFIHELRTSAQPRSWHELSSLRIIDRPFSISPSEPDGAPARSPA